MADEGERRMAEHAAQHDPKEHDLMDPAWRTNHEWVRWLTGTDAQVLLLWLCQAIEADDASLATLREVVLGWRDNALKVVTDDKWTAEVDGYLEIRVDARLAMLSRGKI